MKPVLILGCGPAGLFAAHAAELAGFKPIIASRKRPSHIHGAQYLHRPIGDLGGESFDVKYELLGSVEVYKQKVYGPGYRGLVSPDELNKNHLGWDLRHLYNCLWKRYSDNVVDVTFNNPAEVHAFIASMQGMHSIVSTIPAPLLCADDTHGFQAAKVWAMGDAPELGQSVPLEAAPTNTVLCSGEHDHSWYRKSNILGYNTVEWPQNRKPPLEGVAEVLKPIKTNCTCLPEVHRLGRYGKWTKGVLSHEAFYETYMGLVGVEWS